ncbi:MAG: biopolymer transporter ExbD [Myxococcota bacterium]
MSDTDDLVPEGINDLPDPASFSAPADAPRKKRKKRPPDEPGSLSMNSLLDIMTILLVFLLKSYSTDPVQLKQAADLKPPFSNSEIKPSQSTTLTVTLNNIMVDERPVVKLDGGTVSENDLESNGFLISALYDSLSKSVEHQKRVQQFNKSSKFDGVVTIISDRHVSFSLLTKVMYTAGQAEFSKFKFMVVKG